MRFTLLLLIGLAAVYAAAPTLGGFIGISMPDPMKTFVERAMFKSACVDDGVTLVIDYGTHSGRDTQILCANNFGVSSGDTGWGLFSAASQKVEGTADYPNGFVCRINGFPSKAQDDCSTPANSRSGHWAYYSAKGKGGWNYSHIGAATDQLVCGEWAGWRFITPAETLASTPRVVPTPFKCP